MSAYLIAVDPGRFSGFAEFIDGKLVRTWELSGVDFKTFRMKLVEWLLICKKDDHDHSYYLAIEIPRIYPVAKWKGDPNDLIKVALITGCIVGSFNALVDNMRLKTTLEIKSNIIDAFPHQWKGTTPKKISSDRILNKLTTKEQSVVEPCSSHVIDAIGIGLWALNR